MRRHKHKIHRVEMFCGALVLGLALGGCPSNNAPKPLASAMVGAEGGRLEAPGMVLEIPAGALGETVELSVFEAPSPFPDRELLTPVFRFEPSGLTFEAPATVELTLPEGGAGVVFWSRPDGQGYEPIGLARDGVGRAEVSHFSEGYADGCGDTVELCRCDADEEPHGDVCGHDARRTGGRCEPFTGNLFVGPAAELASGWILRDVIRRLCFCVGPITYSYSGMAVPEYYFCPRPWTARNGGWICESTLDHEKPKNPMEDWGSHAYTFESDLLDVPESCEGYWIDYSSWQSPGANRDGSGFKLGCQDITLDVEWRDEECTTYECGPMSLSDAIARAEGVAEAEARLLGAPEVISCGVVQGTAPVEPTP